jgi:tetratricopeptide (TPR) repeat protein
LAILQKALKRYRDDAELTAAANRVQQTIDRAERERGLTVRVVVIKREVERGNWADALKKIEEARAAFPDNPPELAALEQQAGRLRETECQKLVAKANDALKLGQLAEVEKMLGKQLAPFASEPAVITLANILTEAKSRDGLIQTARGHAAARRLEEAETAINELAARFPGDPEIGRLRTAVASARERQLYDTGRLDGDRLMRTGKYPEAQAHYEYLLTQFPDDAKLKKDLAAAIAGRTREIKVPLPSADAPAPQVRSRTPIYAIAGAVLLGVAGLAYWFWPQSLEVSPDTLHFNTQAGSSSEDRVVVTGTANAPLPKVEPRVDWVSVSRAKSDGNTTEFVVRVSPGNMAPSDSSTNLVFASNKRVRVELKVSPRNSTQSQILIPQIQLDRDSLTFLYSAGTIPAQTFQASSPSAIPEPTPSDKWVSFTRRNLGPGKTEFSVQVSANGLAAGSHNAVLVFTPEKMVRVTLTIPEKPGQEQPKEKLLNVDPLSLAFPDARGGLRQIVTATGPASIPDPVSRDRWLSVTRRSSSTGRAEFMVEAVPGDLPPGRFTGFLTFSSQKRVVVELTVAAKAPPTPELDVQPLELTFQYTRGGPPPAPKSITVTGPPNVAVPPFNAQWLHLTATPAGGKTQFQVQILTDKIEPERDRYREELAFSPAKRVRVELSVTDAAIKIPPPYVNIVWSGTLNAGEQLEIKGRRVNRGASDVPLPTYSGTATVSPDGVKVLSNPSPENNYRLTLRNDSGAAVNSVSIRWTPQK